jgi:predicted nucleotidyltransferase
MLNDDYKEMLQYLLEERVSFLLVGAYALAAHGFPRATKDIDLFVHATPDNAGKLMRALARFGAPLTDVSVKDFSTEDTVFQIGSGPRRIDIVTSISGVAFEQAFQNHETITVDGLAVPVIARNDLIANKRAAGRAQDLADVERLTGMEAGD